MSTDEYILDIEGDNLLPSISNIWAAVVNPVEDGDPYVITKPSDLADWIKAFKPKRIIGHNILGFDLPAIHRVWGIPYLVNFLGDDNWNGERTEFVDTLQLSQFLNADRPFGHSLENWGEYLGYQKDNFSDWSKLSDEMISYCIRDTEVTKRVYKQLLKEKEDGYN